MSNKKWGSKRFSTLITQLISGGIWIWPLVGLVPKPLFFPLHHTSLGKKHPPPYLHCCFSVARSCLILCNPRYYSTPGFPVLHHFPDFAQTHVHWLGDANQPSHPRSLSSPPPVFPSIRGFSSESALRIRWQKYWSFSFSISPLLFQNWFSMYRDMASPSGSRWRLCSVARDWSDLWGLSQPRDRTGLQATSVRHTCGRLISLRDISSPPGKRKNGLENSYIPYNSKIRYASESWLPYPGTGEGRFVLRRSSMILGSEGTRPPPAEAIPADCNFLQLLPLPPAPWIVV